MGLTNDPWRLGSRLHRRLRGWHCYHVIDVMVFKGYRMKGVGEGIAFAGFTMATAWLEVNNISNGFFWFCVVVWLISSNWGQKCDCNQSHSQTVESLARLEQIKRHIYENRDREVTQGELIAQFDISRTSANSACNRLAADRLINWSTRDGKRYYKWISEDLRR